MIAHRGYSSLLPELSMESIETCLFAGVDYIEIDVQLSKDEELMVFHDPFFERNTNIKLIDKF